MKRLIPTRHAKSSWDDPAMSDHDRPLNERGRAAAADLGQWMASRGYLPQEVLCSDAPSAPARLGKASPPSCRWPRRSPTSPRLHHAGADVMMAVLRHATAEVVMMIGHNPGIARIRPSHRLAQPEP